MIKHTSFVFVVMSKKDSTIVGVYDDFRDAEDRLNEQLGRPLKKGEIVHHRDGDKWNNSPENLEVMTQSEHCTLHLKQRWGVDNA